MLLLGRARQVYKKKYIFFITLYILLVIFRPNASCPHACVFLLNLFKKKTFFMILQFCKTQKPHFLESTFKITYCVLAIVNLTLPACQYLFN